MQYRILIGITLLAVVICGLVAWATPRPLGDLYMALAGGRDVVQGKLGAADDWSFISAGRVWVNQSWGSHVLFYGTHRVAGDTGLLFLKAILLGGIVAAVFVAARVRGAAAPAALIAGGSVLVASTSGMVLRPNLFSLLLTPLLFFFLYRSRENPRWLWAGTALVLLWANVHGAFLVGVAVLVIWALAHLLGWMFAKSGEAPAPWSMIVAAIVAAAGTALLNPFGVWNVQLPFRAAGEPAWRNIREWLPVFSEDFPTPWLFLVPVGVLLASFLARLVVNGMRRTPRNPERLAEFLFEILVVAGVLVMTFQARRYIPLAAVVLAPLLARQLTWVLSPRRWVIPTALVALGLVVGALYPNRWIPDFYDLDNPIRPRESVLERMVFHGTDFPAGPAEFINANAISGNIYQPWEWEGYLRWHCPSVTLFMGGRAQQIYTGEEFLLTREILLDPEPAVRLKEWDVHVVTVPLNLKHGRFVERLLLGSDGTWSYVYCDRRFAVLADIVTPATREVVSRAGRGELVYPDEAIAALSRGMCLATPAVEAPDAWTVEALETANRLMPTDFSYPIWENRAKSGGATEAERAAYLDGELNRLLDMPVDVAEGVEVLKARERVARLVSGLYPDMEKRRTAVLIRQETIKRVRELLAAPL
jgi:hypothetical protein